MVIAATLAPTRAKAPRFGQGAFDLGMQVIDDRAW